MGNGSEITRSHFNVAVGIISSLGGILIGLIVYIWVSAVAYQEKRDEIQDRQHKELMRVVGNNELYIDAIKKHILQTDNVDIDDKVWKLLLDEFDSKTRGSSAIEQKDESYADMQ